MEVVKSLKEKDNRKALYAALIFMMLMLLFFLLVSLDEPDPPMQEEIIEIEFGGELEGGSAASEEITEEVVEETVTESAEEIETQEESPVVVASGQNQSSSTSTNTQEAKPDPVDNSLGFPGGGGTTGSGTGNGPGFGNGTGLNGDGGKGVDDGMGTENLSRKCIDKGGLPVQTQEEGKVVIDVWVNDKGEVVKVKLNSKTNTASNNLIGLAKRFAKTRLYQKLLGAPTQFVGSVTYNFTKE